MNISYRISIILVMLFAIVAPRCHALSDFDGREWRELPGVRP